MPSILLIEDDDLFREALAGALGVALAERGFTVTQAVDGEQGVRAFRAAPTDLVITDIVMPNPEGIETIKALQRENPKIGIIAMAGGHPHDTQLYLKVAGALGAARILQKPFDLPAMLAAIEETLARSPTKAGTVP